MCTKKLGVFGYARQLFLELHYLGLAVIAL